MKTVIKKSDTIYAIVDRYPELREVLKDLSPKFRKLDNPVLFNTLARAATVEQAAKVGGLYLREFLYRLNEAVGLGSEYLAEEKAAIREGLKTGKGLQAVFEAAGRDRKGPDKPEEIPAWIDGSETFFRLDARAEGGDPFDRVNKLADGTASGGGFVLIQSFEPVPLVRHLLNRGFESYVHRKSGAEYWIYFYKPEQGGANGR